MQVDVRVLFDFTYWANDRVLQGAKTLSDDQLTAPIRPGFSSTLELLVHMMAAERIWLSRWKGESPRQLQGVEDIPSLAVLQETWTVLRAEILNFVLKIDDPNYVVVYRSTKGIEFRNSLWSLVLHVINHSTEHRSQIALYLATQGIDVGNLDLIAYLRETT